MADINELVGIFKTTKMFGLFKQKTNKPSVTPDDKDWIEKNINWFIEVFGIDKLKETPFILPTIENFPYDNLKDDEQFQKIFEQLCKYWDLKPNEIKIKIFDDFASKHWTTWIPHGKWTEPSGLYSQTYTLDEQRFTIQLAKSNLNNPQLFVAVLAHELAHVKLLGGNYVNRNDADMEPLTDLACIFFGFGIFVANSCQTKDLYWMGRSGYLPNEIISYSNALVCYITEKEITPYLQYFNTNTNELFQKDYEFLSETNDTLLTKHKVSESQTNYELYKKIDDGFKSQNFISVIEACNQLLKITPKNITVFNNLGYALLQQRKYKEAIDFFTKAIDVDPYFDYPYNNRGYCNLQLGHLEDAFIDLHHSFEMNPDNSFSHRNLGAYYLKTNEFEKALGYFEHAEKIDPKTEMINFYLSQVHSKLDNVDKSKMYADKSSTLKEHNDSTIQ